MSLKPHVLYQINNELIYYGSFLFVPCFIYSPTLNTFNAYASLISGLLCHEIAHTLSHVSGPNKIAYIGQNISAQWQV